MTSLLSTAWFWLYMPYSHPCRVAFRQAGLEAYAS